jgi:PIN domain nuclease of toxin-antitoxin system
MGRSLLILLDTHVVIWLVAGDPKLSKRAEQAIDDARLGVAGLAISDFTLYEITLASRKKRIDVHISVESLLFELEQRFVVLPITREVCMRTLSFPVTYPRDPADRIIGATALAHELTLVTADQAIRDSGAVPTIW